MKKKFTYIVLLLICAGGIVAYMFLLGDGITPLVDEEQEKEINSIVPELERMVLEHPTDSDMKKDLAYAKFLLGDFEESEKNILEALKTSPEYPLYYVDLGRIYEARGEYEKAEEVYKEALRLNTENVSLDRPVSLPYSEQLAELIPKDKPYLFPTPFVVLARLYLDRLGRTDEAIAILEEGMQAQEDYVDFYYMLLSAWEKKGNIEKAQQYRDMIKLLR